MDVKKIEMENVEVKEADLGKAGMPKQVRIARKPVGLANVPEEVGKSEKEEEEEEEGGEERLVERLVEIGDAQEEGSDAETPTATVAREGDSDGDGYMILPSDKELGRKDAATSMTPPGAPEDPTDVEDFEIKASPEEEFLDFDEARADGVLEYQVKEAWVGNGDHCVGRSGPEVLDSLRRERSKVLYFRRAGTGMALRS